MGNTERSVLVRLNANPAGFVAGFKVAQSAAKDLRKEIDTTNNRSAILVQSLLAVGPSLAPISAAAVPALAGLATQFTIAGVAAGTAALAFNGVGDALKALNDYQIDPTDAHLKKLHQTMAFIGPTGRDLVRVLDQMRDSFIGLSNLSRDKMFPGVIDGLHELESLGPRVQQIVAKVASEIGHIADLGGQQLGGKRFADFFKFIEAEAVPTLDAMAHTILNVTAGLADMLIAFKPLADGFTHGMLQMSRAFADWAHGLKGTSSFQEFMDYVRANTPRVLHLIAQLADTFVQIVEAAAPVGSLTLPIFTELLKVIGAIANSPLGPFFIGAVAAIGIYGRTVALASVSTNGLAGKMLKTALGVDGLKAALKGAGAEVVVAQTETELLAKILTAVSPAATVAGDAMVTSSAKAKVLTEAMRGARIEAVLFGDSAKVAAAGVDLALGAASVKARILGDDLAAIALKDSVPASIKAQIEFEASLGASDLAVRNLTRDVEGFGLKTAETFTLAGREVRAFSALTEEAGAAAATGGRGFGEFGRALGPAAVSLGAFAFALSPLPEKMHLTAAANGALLGSFLGPEGAAVGAAVGGFLDLSSALVHLMSDTKSFKGDADTLRTTLDQQTGAITANTRAFVLNELAQKGVIDAAARIGISADTIVNAYLGQKLAVDQVNQAIDGFTVSSNLSADQADKYRSALELVSSALADGKVKLAGAREGMLLTGDVVDTTTRKFKAATRAVNEFEDATDDLKAKLEDRSSFRGYQAAIDALSRGIRKDKKPGFDLSPFDARGRGHQELLDTLASSIQDYAAKLPVDKQKAFLDDAEKGFDKLARKMGFVTNGPLEDLKKRLGLLDLFNARPGVHVEGTGKAKGEIDHIAQIMDHLDKMVANPKVLISVLNDRALHTESRLGPGFDKGGFTGYMDKHTVAGLVHGREFVVPAPYAERDRAMLEKRYLPGYRQGGYVEPARLVPAAGPSLSAGDLDRIGEAAGVAAARFARPLYGDQYVSGDPTTWRRQREADLRSAAVGGLIDAG